MCLDCAGRQRSSGSASFGNHPQILGRSPKETESRGPQGSRLFVVRRRALVWRCPSPCSTRATAKPSQPSTSAGHPRVRRLKLPRHRGQVRSWFMALSPTTPLRRACARSAAAVPALRPTASSLGRPPVSTRRRGPSVTVWPALWCAAYWMPSTGCRSPSCHRRLGGHRTLPSSSGSRREPSVLEALFPHVRRPPPRRRLRPTRRWLRDGRQAPQQNSGSEQEGPLLTCQQKVHA